MRSLLRRTCLGLVLTSAAVAATLGAAASSFITERVGTGLALVYGQRAVVVSAFVFPAAALAPGFSVPILMSGQVAYGMGMRVFSVNQISLRQAITAPELLGRVNATRRFIVFGIQPVGALFGGVLGGVLGGAIGLAPALLVAAGCQLLSVAPLLGSPVPRLGWLPDAPLSGADRPRVANV